MVSLASACLIGFVAVLWMPVRFLAYSNLNDGQLTPFGPITEKHTLTDCISGDFRNLTGIELFLADYNRKNTNENIIEISGKEDIKKTKPVFSGSFDSRDVIGNRYLALSLPSVSVENELCVKLASTGNRGDNAITIWLNTNNRPVYRLYATDSMVELLKYIIPENIFPIPYWLVFLFCWLFMSANAFMIIFVVQDYIYEKQKKS